jgi:hypothetical protein
LQLENRERTRIITTRTDSIIEQGGKMMLKLESLKGEILDSLKDEIHAMSKAQADLMQSTANAVLGNTVKDLFDDLQKKIDATLGAKLDQLVSRSKPSPPKSAWGTRLTDTQDSRRRNQREPPVHQHPSHCNNHPLGLRLSLKRLPIHHSGCRYIHIRHFSHGLGRLRTTAPPTCNNTHKANGPLCTQHKATHRPHPQSQPSTSAPFWKPSASPIWTART